MRIRENAEISFISLSFPENETDQLLTPPYVSDQRVEIQTRVMKINVMSSSFPLIFVLLR